MSLPPDVEAKYTGIIDSILAISDLDTISRKGVRKGIQAAFDYDITPQKAAINALIDARFDRLRDQKINSSAAVVKAPASNGAPAPAPAPAPTPAATSTNATSVNGTYHHSKASSQSASASPATTAATIKHEDYENHSDELFSHVDHDEDAARRPKKKVKRATSEDDDAAFAARLQAEENSRARPTRGGAVRKRNNAVPKSTPKKGKKSKSTVRAEDDSDVESGSGADKPVKRNGAFHKPFNLSPALVELTGETSLSRPQTVKRIWDYVKAHDLQDPSDKRQIRCDGALRAVFKQDSVHMFTMNKILSKNLYPIEE